MTGSSGGRIREASSSAIASGPTLVIAEGWVVDDVARERLSQLRRMWALLVAGGGAGFAGLAFVLSSIHHWWVNPERDTVEHSS